MTTVTQRSVTLRDGREVSIRPAVPDDAGALVDYMNQGLVEYTEYILTDADEFDMTVEKEREWIASQKHECGAIALIAEAAGEVVGMLNCTVRPRRRISHVGELGMTLRRSYWGSGLGSALMESLIEWAEAHPVLEMLQLQVYACNDRALGLYRKFRFVEAGRFPGRTKFGPGEYKDDVLMYRRVDGAVAS